MNCFISSYIKLATTINFYIQQQSRIEYCNSEVLMRVIALEAMPKCIQYNLMRFFSSPFIDFHYKTAYEVQEMFTSIPALLIAM